jgi:sugar transferase EpsL
MNLFAKRFIDVLVSGIALLLTSPLMFVVAVAIKAIMGRPVLFKQMRPGYQGKPFALLKFRTMNERRDEQGRLLPDAKRLTPLGSLLRRLSLDELPQLWNVFRGDMSLVGPRPLLIQYMDRYSCDQARRHDVKPGLTGWAQVNGRNSLTWSEKLTLDVWYVDNQTLGLDARILFRTVWQVVKQQGISQQGHASMPEFLGSERDEL